MGVYDEEEQSIFQRYRGVIGCSLIAAVALAVWLGRGRFDQKPRSRQDQDMVLVNLPPPPPPPPAQVPPPPTENEEKMIDQEPVNEMETKPDETAKPEPADNSPALGTSIQGNGSSDGFGLRAGNGFVGGTGKTVSHGTSSRWGWYANQVQSAISQALQSNNNTRTADFRVIARVWTDQTGRITRARIGGSTGSAALDNALTNEVLVGLILQQPPPDGMPMPIVLRLTARQSQAALSR